MPTTGGLVNGSRPATSQHDYSSSSFVSSRARERGFAIATTPIPSDSILYSDKRRMMHTLKRSATPTTPDRREEVVTCILNGGNTAANPFRSTNPEYLAQQQRIAEERARAPEQAYRVHMEREKRAVRRACGNDRPPQYEDAEDVARRQAALPKLSPVLRRKVSTPTGGLDSATTANTTAMAMSASNGSGMGDASWHAVHNKPFGIFSSGGVKADAAEDANLNRLSDALRRAISPAGYITRTMLRATTAPAGTTRATSSSGGDGGESNVNINSNIASSFEVLAGGDYHTPFTLSGSPGPDDDQLNYRDDIEIFEMKRAARRRYDAEELRKAHAMQLELETGINEVITAKKLRSQKNLKRLNSRYDGGGGGGTASASSNTTVQQPLGSDQPYHPSHGVPGLVYYGRGLNVEYPDRPPINPAVLQSVVEQKRAQEAYFGEKVSFGGMDDAMLEDEVNKRFGSPRSRTGMSSRHSSARGGGGRGSGSASVAGDDDEDDYDAEYFALYGRGGGEGEGPEGSPATETEGYTTVSTPARKTQQPPAPSSTNFTADLDGFEAIDITGGGAGAKNGAAGGAHGEAEDARQDLSISDDGDAGFGSRLQSTRPQSTESMQSSPYRSARGGVGGGGGGSNTAGGGSSFIPQRKGTAAGGSGAGLGRPPPPPLPLAAAGGMPGVLRRAVATGDDATGTTVTSAVLTANTTANNSSRVSTTRRDQQQLTGRSSAAPSVASSATGGGRRSVTASSGSGGGRGEDSVADESDSADEGDDDGEIGLDYDDDGGGDGNGAGGGDSSDEEEFRKQKAQLYRQKHAEQQQRRSTLLEAGSRGMGAVRTVFRPHGGAPTATNTTPTAAAMAPPSMGGEFDDADLVEMANTQNGTPATPSKTPNNGGLFMSPPQHRPGTSGGAMGLTPIRMSHIGGGMGERPATVPTTRDFDTSVAGTLPRNPFAPPRIIIMLFSFANVMAMPCVETMRKMGYSVLYERFHTSIDKSSSSMTKTAYTTVMKSILPDVPLKDSDRLFACFERTGRGDIDVNVFLMGLQMLLGCATPGDALRYCIKSMDPRNGTPRYITRYEIQSILRCVQIQNNLLMVSNASKGIQELTDAQEGGAASSPSKGSGTQHQQPIGDGKPRGMFFLPSASASLAMQNMRPATTGSAMTQMSSLSEMGRLDSPRGGRGGVLSAFRSDGGHNNSSSSGGQHTVYTSSNNNVSEATRRATFAANIAAVAKGYGDSTNNNYFGAHTVLSPAALAGTERGNGGGGGGRSMRSGSVASNRSGEGSVANAAAASSSGHNRTPSRLGTSSGGGSPPPSRQQRVGGGNSLLPRPQSQGIGGGAARKGPQQQQQQHRSSSISSNGGAHGNNHHHDLRRISSGVGGASRFAGGSSPTARGGGGGGTSNSTNLANGSTAITIGGSVGSGVAVDREFTVMYNAIVDLFEDTTRYDYLGRMALKEFVDYISTKLSATVRVRRSSTIGGPSGVLDGGPLVAPAHRLNSKQLVLQHVHQTFVDTKGSTVPVKQQQQHQ